jgi:pimeloyl-ACP methyl ester carboxylesterase
MATVVPVHAAGDSAWSWQLLGTELAQRGHEMVAVDLPAGDPDSTLGDYADVVLDAVTGRSDLVVVGHSFGGFTAPLICERVAVDLLVMLAPMIPTPGERPDDWWSNTGWAYPPGTEDLDEVRRYYDGVPPELAAEALKRERDYPSTRSGREPWPLERWPDVPTRVVAPRDDHLFGVEFQQRQAKERLGIDAEVIDGAHCVSLSHPSDLADRLIAAWHITR